ncbi:TIGR03013 family XrtA/PEP-CTERM system glycosyltransferase [Pseudoxanthomonas putridarboris]|uniref:TIGR03013 family XrtA/PEP-CTERM system glycosyltransferase n=2 Tax=Pseudoxanthomonas putridarboris TaxID=752605 RepID=A0ABU9IYG3_9GAMM
MRMIWLLEVLVLMLCVAAAAWLRFLGDVEGHAVFIETAPLRALLVALVITGAMAAFGLYQAHGRHNRANLLLRLALSFFFGGIGLLVIFYAVPQTYVGRGPLALTLGLGFVALLGMRLTMQNLLQVEALRQRVLVFGAGNNANLINRRMRRQADRKSFVIVGFVPIPGQAVVVREEELLATDCESLATLVEELDVDEVIIAPDERRGALPMEEMLKCVQYGVSVVDLSTFFERESGTVQLSVVDPSWLVFSGGFDYSMPRRLSKRLFDLSAALLLLALAWPVMLLVALAVYAESGGPVLYRQTRVGERGRHFELTKFRSMRQDAEKGGVAIWASKNDDRTTRVGKFIRLTRLDELPQLFAVIRGHMSFVGPRPERPHFVDMLNEQVRYYGVRHSIKPGLTGWAQLRYPYGASVQDAEEKLKFDLFYVKNHGLVFDLMILLQTVEVVLFGRGAR